MTEAINGPPIPSTPAPTLFERDTCTGDCAGLRPKLGARGLSFSLLYQAEVFGNTGGADQGVVSDGLVNFGLDLDLQKLTGFWKGASMHANAYYIYGQNLSAKYIGDFSTTSNIAAYNTLRLQEAWFEQKFCDERFSIRAGLLAADTEFFASDTSALFIDSTFAAFPLIGLDFSDPPIYPVANPGVRFNFAPNPSFYLKAAVFGEDSSSNPAGNNANGTRFRINAADSALFVGEVGYLRHSAPDDKGLRSAFRLGGFVQPAEYASFDSQADAALGTGRVSGKGTNYAFYAVADQEVYQHDDRAIAAFIRGGFACSRLSFVDDYVDAGFNFTGFLPGRAKDIGGVAFAYSHVSDEFSEASVRQSGPAYTYEAVLELTYKIVLAPWWSVQPDLQCVFNPSGVRDSRDAFVFGVRTSVAF